MIIVSLRLTPPQSLSMLLGSLLLVMTQFGKQRMAGTSSFSLTKSRPYHQEQRIVTSSKLLCHTGLKGWVVMVALQGGKCPLPGSYCQDVQDAFWSMLVNDLTSASQGNADPTVTDNVISKLNDLFYIFQPKASRVAKCFRLLQEFAAAASLVGESGAPILITVCFQVDKECNRRTAAGTYCALHLPHSLNIEVQCKPQTPHACTLYL
jgi:hypothetical protein